MQIITGDVDPTIRVIRRSGRWKHKQQNGTKQEGTVAEEELDEVNDEKTLTAQNNLFSKGNQKMKNKGNS